MESENSVTESEARISQKPKCRVIALIPAFNEDRFIGSVVLKVLNYVDAVVVVDDGSSDSTKEIAEAAGAVVVQHEINKGKGVALNTGLAKVRELEPDAVVMLDADGQHNPAEIPTLVKRVLVCDDCDDRCAWREDEEPEGNLDKADIIIGSRYLENMSEVPRHRIMGHWFFNWVTKFTSGVVSTDSQSGFRAFSTKALEVLSFSSSGFSVESEMQMIAKEHKLRVIEAPIVVTYKEKPKRNVFQHGLQVLNGILRLAGQYRPLLFMGVPGLILLLLGFSWGWWVVDIYRRIQVLAVGYTMISLLLAMTGMVLLSTGVILHSVRGLLIDMLRHRENPDKIGKV